MGCPKPPRHVGIGEGGAQPLSGLACPLPLAHEAPQHLPGLPKHLSVMLVITRYLRNTPGLQKPFVQYINLYLQTIPELLITSGISSGTPNNIR